MKNKNSIKYFQYKHIHRQQGATLFTALVFLTLMTIVSVSAAKIASLDTIVAGTNQQVAMVFQQTSKTLSSFTNPIAVIKAIADNEGVKNTWSKTLPPRANDPNTANANRQIKNRNADYPCKADGLATSIGDTQAKCFVFDLSSEDRLLTTNITDKHFRGVGKALPNTSQYE
ncbi:MAG: pilus assembly PilX N-terminal domain-containing protein [Cocleimonas sp.]